MDQPGIDADRVDDAVLALTYLTFHAADRLTGLVRAWKSFDWDAMDRLRERDLIFDPVNKAKSVALTEEGRRRSEELFYKLFVRAEPDSQ